MFECSDPDGYLWEISQPGAGAAPSDALAATRASWFAGEAPRVVTVMLVATMTVRREAVDEFRAFERRAAAIMATYGGVIERSIVADDGATPLQEIHVVSFPDEQAFAAYQADEGLKRIALLRERSVIQTLIVRGEADPDYRPE